MVRHSPVLPILTLVLAGSAGAQVVPVPVFSGTLSEGFEPPVTGNGVVCAEARVFRGIADVCTPFGVGIDIVPMHVEPPFAIRPQAGSFFLRSLDGFVPGIVELGFDFPIEQFGGYFAMGFGQQSMIVAFYDGTNLIGTAPIDAVATGEWRWNGWALGVPANRVQIVPGINGFYFFDSLEAVLEGGGLGTPYCTSLSNSSGGSAQIFATGSASVAANDLVLHANPVSQGQPGLYIYGPSAVQLPTANGFLCVGSPARLPVVFAQGYSQLFAFDNGAPTFPPYQVVPGSTWYFQAWFRDPPAGPPGFNWSDGVGITFVP